MIPNALPQTNIQHILYSVSYIPAPIPNRDLGCKFLVLYILKSQAFWTLVPNFVSKCEDRSASLFLLVAHLHPSREAGVLWPIKGVFSLTFQGCPLSKSQLPHFGESQNFSEKRERNDR